MDHIKKVKTLANQLTCLDVPVKSEDIVMILLESLLPLYKYLITVLETMLMKELTMEFVTSCLMHEMLKMEDKKPQGDEIAFLMRFRHSEQSILARKHQDV